MGVHASRLGKLVERCRDHGVLDEALATKIAETLKVRGLIVHRYVEVDYSRLYVEAKGLMDVVKGFETQLAGLLRKEEQ